LRGIDENVVGCEEEDEFDLIAAAEPEPDIHPPAVFSSRSRDHADTVQENVAEVEDSRITSLIEMGFTAQQAESALDACDGDVNAALTMLLSE